MDPKRIAMYARMGKPIIVEPEDNKLYSFLEALFGRRRMLVIKSGKACNQELVTVLEKYASRKNLEFGVLQIRGMSADDVRGRPQTVMLDGKACFERDKPSYWPKDRRKMIVVDGVNQNTDIEVLKALLYVTCIGDRYDLRYLPEDKLPAGSGFVFLADDTFPQDSFDSITTYWRQEARVFEFEEINKHQGGSRSMVINRSLRNENFTRMQKDLEFLLKTVKEGKGELDISLREDYINLYYQGNSLAKIEFLPDNHYRVSINKKFVSGTSIDGNAKFTLSNEPEADYRSFKVDPDRVHSLLQKKHIIELCSKIREVNNGDEITFEQMLITDNLNRPEFIILDRQITDKELKRKRMDLLALVHDESSNQYVFCVLEVKTGRNAELKDAVAAQLEGYVRHIETHFTDYRECYTRHYEQKRTLGLLGDKLPSTIKIGNGVKGLVVVGRYSGLAADAISQLQSKHPTLRVWQAKYKLEYPN